MLRCCDGCDAPLAVSCTSNTYLVTTSWQYEIDYGPVAALVSLGPLPSRLSLCFRLHVSSAAACKAGDGRETGETVRWSTRGMGEVKRRSQARSTGMRAPSSQRAPLRGQMEMRADFW